MLALLVATAIAGPETQTRFDLAKTGAAWTFSYGWKDARDGRAPLAAGMEQGSARDLRVHVGRGVHQEPALAIGGDGERVLGARPRAGRSGACRGATGAPAVPLREASAGRGS